MKVKKRILYWIYLFKWKMEHRGDAFKKMHPCCFQEWLDYKYQEKPHKYKKTIYLTQEEKKRYKNILSSCYMSEEETIVVKTVRFPNEMEMDIKICGADEEQPWMEAVLFKNNCEVNHTDVFSSFEKEWEIQYEENLYIIYIKTKKGNHKHESKKFE